MSDTATVEAPATQSEPVASTPAPATETSSAYPSDLKTLDQMTRDERQQWRLTGEVPKKSADTAASAPAQPAEQAASTDATPSVPASDPGKPVKPKTEARFQELLDDRARLRQELEQLRAQLTPTPASTRPQDGTPGSSPAPVTLEQVINTPNVSRPPLSDGEFFSAFPDATAGDLAQYRASYQIQRTEAMRSYEQQARAHQDAISQRATAYQERFTAATTADPALMSRLSPDVLQLRPLDILAPHEVPTVDNAIAQGIITSEAPAMLMEHLSTHPQDLAQLRALPQTPLGFLEAARAIGRLEARLTGTTPAVATPKTVTSAPPPPQTLGTKATPPSDDAAEALRAGNFRRYRQIMNQRETAAAR